jgi:hypothetical protein
MTVFCSRTKQRADAAGTADFTFVAGASLTGFRRFEDRLADGDDLFYCAVDPVTREFEIGTGFWVASSKTLMRIALYETSDAPYGTSPTPLDFVNSPVVFADNPGYFIDTLFGVFSQASQLLIAITADGAGNITHTAGIADGSTTLNSGTTTGFNIQIPDSTSGFIIDSTGALATGTLVMPQEPFPKQQLYICSQENVAALTHTPGTGHTIRKPLTALVGGVGHVYWFNDADSKWYTQT